MLTSEFDYNLPQELIAQTPVSPRDSSRLMVVDKKTHNTRHKQFKDITQFLSPGDLLVWNNTKVFKARLKGQVMLDETTDDISDKLEKKLGLSDRILNMPVVEIFLVRPMENFGVWKVLAKPGRKLRLGMKVVFAEDFVCEIIAKENDGTVLVEFNDDDIIVRTKANKYGQVPTPPYIKQATKYMDQSTKLKDDYQTVYAKSEGSVAAPTAGFHFTLELIEQLKNKGVEFAEVTLHVGLGTFLPIKTKKVKDHKMYSEWVELTASNADKINIAKQEGRRVIAVGTTTIRTLEGIAVNCHPELDSGSNLQGLKSEILKPSNSAGRQVQDDSCLKLRPYTGDINLFITPGFEFRIIDAMITNFHLPKSTLLMLVSAFVKDTDFIIDCYKQAIEARYRFYSFGDAMLIK